MIKKLSRSAYYPGIWLIGLILLAILAFIEKPVPGEAMITATRNFMESLSEDQFSRAVFALEDTTRTIWHYLPEASFNRYGIALHELDEDQDRLVYDLLRVSLSEKGYYKATTIMDLETILRDLEQNATTRDPQQYHIAIYGTPDLEETWGWGISGHHLSLHFTMVEGQLSTTPTFMGSNPAEVRTGPSKGLRVLQQEEDLALELINALPAAQRNKAIFLDKSPYEIYTAAKSKVEPLEQLGLSYRDMSAEHRAMLQNLVAEYLGTLPRESAKLRQEKIEAEGWEDIHFAWAGVTSRDAGHYYRVQGSTFLIEFDNTQNDANHIHTVWRDFDGDFGRDLLHEHYHDQKGHHKH